MSTTNESKSREPEIAGTIDAILRLDQEDRVDSVIYYRPSFRKFCKTTNSAILLGRIWFWFQRSNYRAFYKFNSPCQHKKYREGDSWAEELGFSDYEIQSALKNFAIKIERGVKKSAAFEEAIVVYWTDSDRITWYEINLINFAKAIHSIYDEIALGKPRLSTYLVRLDSQITGTSEHVGLPSFTNTTPNTTTNTTKPSDFADAKSLGAEKLCSQAIDSPSGEFDRMTQNDSMPNDFSGQHLIRATPQNEKTLEETNPPDETGTSRSNDIHELFRLIAYAYPEKPYFLSEAQERRLQREEVVIVNGETEIRPSPVDLFDSDALFRQFVAYAIKRRKYFAPYSNTKFGRASRSDIVEHIRGYMRKDGWLRYESQNRSVFNAASIAEAPDDYE